MNLCPPPISTGRCFRCGRLRTRPRFAPNRGRLAELFGAGDLVQVGSDGAVRVKSDGTLHIAGASDACCCTGCTYGARDITITFAGVTADPSCFAGGGATLGASATFLSYNGSFVMPGVPNSFSNPSCRWQKSGNGVSNGDTDDPTTQWGTSYALAGCSGAAAARFGWYVVFVYTYGGAGTLTQTTQLFATGGVVSGLAFQNTFGVAWDGSATPIVISNSFTSSTSTRPWYNGTATITIA